MNKEEAALTESKELQQEDSDTENDTSASFGSKETGKDASRQEADEQVLQGVSNNNELSSGALNTDASSQVKPESDLSKCADGGQIVSLSLACQNPEKYRKDKLCLQQIYALEHEADEQGYVLSWDEKGYLKLYVPQGDTEVYFSRVWPKNSFTDAVPAPKKGNIVVSSDFEDGCVVVMKWTLDEAKEYASILKNEGFAPALKEYEVDGGYLFYAEQKGLGVGVVFNPESVDDSGISLCKK